MRKLLTIVALLCAVGVAGVQAASKNVPATSKKAPAAQAAGALYPCTEDCDTREGGYNWAEHYAIANAAECKGTNAAFIDGCKDFVDEVKRPADRRAGERDDRRYGDNRYGNDDRSDYRSGNGSAYRDNGSAYRDDDNDDRYRQDDRYRGDDNRYGDREDDRYGDREDDRYRDDDDNGYDENDNDDHDGYDDGDNDEDDDDDGGRTGSLQA